MTAVEIAAALGVVRRSGQWWRCVCPVHRSRTGRSLALALRDHPRGLIVHCHAGCSRDDVLAELRRIGLLAGNTDTARAVAAYSVDRADVARRIAAARRIWDAARDARGSPVVRYLAGRGISIPAPASLRWLPRCNHPNGVYLPAMVARVDNVDGELIALHRTFLQTDGNGKANIAPQKASLGPVGGGAVRLAPVGETLLIGEGIESTAAGMIATGLPGWAALSAAGIERLKLPPEVLSLVIAVDRDRNGTGERSARRAAGRWFAEGRRVRLIIPNRIGADANDLLREARHAA